MDVTKQKITAILNEQATSRRGLDIRTAFNMLRQNASNGGIHHEFLGENCYLIASSQGQFKFYDATDDKVHLWESSDALYQHILDGMKNDPSQNLSEQKIKTMMQSNWDYLTKQDILKFLAKNDAWWDQNVG
jgi:hypothetical protein